MLSLKTILKENLTAMDKHVFIICCMETNHAEQVVIGDHVWLTAHVRVLKGSVIPSNSIIGNSNVVTSRLDTKNALYSGIPCKLLKEHIDWDRYKIECK